MTGYPLVVTIKNRKTGAVSRQYFSSAAAADMWAQGFNSALLLRSETSPVHYKLGRSVRCEGIGFSDYRAGRFELHWSLEE